MKLPVALLLALSLAPAAFAQSYPARPVKIIVPYPAGGYYDVASGQTEFAFATTGDVLAHIRGGKLRALAVTSAKRIPALADTPTMIEAGVPGYEATAWFALFAPASTPRDIVTRLNAVAGKALQTDEVRERLAPQGSADLVGGTPEHLGALVRSEIVKWSKVVKESGATAD